MVMQEIMKSLSTSKIFQKVTVSVPMKIIAKHMAAVVYDIQGTGESAVKEKLKDLEKEELLTVLNRLLQSSKTCKL